jgi:cytochrome bd-type quinol oxidase subunit 2
MPTAPIIIPVIVAGITLGSLLASESHKITKKKLLGTSLVSGLLNVANAYAIYLLFPPPSFSRFSGGGTFTGGGGGFTGGGTAFRSAASSPISFLVLSFITGFLIVLVIVEVALFYARRKSGQSEEEETEPEKEEEEPKLEEDDDKET